MTALIALLRDPENSYKCNQIEVISFIQTMYFYVKVSITNDLSHSKLWFISFSLIANLLDNYQGTGSGECMFCEVCQKLLF